MAAEACGLLRDAARLRKHAIAKENVVEAQALVQSWHFLLRHAADPRPAQWAAAHAAFDDPFGLALLLDAMRWAGANSRLRHWQIGCPLKGSLPPSGASWI
jgi:hypothetical protein